MYTHARTHTQGSRYGMDDPGFETPSGREIFWKHPDRLRGPPSLRYYGKRASLRENGHSYTSPSLLSPLGM
jgi:hypothetical protein